MHAPGTDRNDEYPVINGEYASKLDDPKIKEEFRNRILEAELDAVGVTDYYSIDNFEKLVTFQKNEGYLSEILLIPNIELRLEDQTWCRPNSTVNIHVLFDPQKIDAQTIKSDFINRLTIRNGGKTYFYTNISQLAMDNGISETQAKEQFILDKTELLQLLSQSPSLAGKYLIAVPNDDFSGAFHNPSGKATFLYDEISNLTDLVFSHSTKDVDFWLDKDPSNQKPVISGSDAHSFKNKNETGSHYGIGEEYTWIKSDLSFEGLRQVLFEPKSRVRIKESSRNNPIESRSGYIKKIQLDSKSDQIQIVPNEIPISSNLTTIIGARSSGKSVLEALIAHKNYVDDPDHIAKKRLATYEEITKNVSIILKGDSSDEFTNKVTYYPQNFISDLSENVDTLQKLITDIVMEKPELNKLISNYRTKINASLSDIKELVSEYKECNVIVKKASEELLAFGKEKDLFSEREFLNTKRRKVYAESSLSAEDKVSRTNLESEYQQVLEEYTDVDENMRHLAENWNILEQDFTSIEKQLPLISGNVPNTFKDTVEIDSLISSAQEFKNKVISYLEILGNKIQAHFNELKNQKSEIESKLKEFQMVDTSLNSQLLSYNEQIKNLDNQISQIQLLSSKKTNAEKQRDKLQSDLFEIIKEIQELYTTAPQELSQSLSLGIVDEKNIKLTLQNFINFDVLDFFDKRKLANASDSVKLITQSPNTFNWGETDALIEEFKTLLESDASIFVKKNEAIDVIFDIVNKIFPLKLDLIYGSDSLTSMSPGMRGVVLLQVLLKTQNTQSPILLDQPEDDLDNNTIAEVLVPLIKEVASNRQVILVTHNANLVVLTDADEVIVAERNDSDFNVKYHHGPLENDDIKNSITTLLEGGKDAFKLREKRYDFEVKN